MRIKTNTIPPGITNCYIEHFVLDIIIDTNDVYIMTGLRLFADEWGNKNDQCEWPIHN